MLFHSSFSILKIMNSVKQKVFIFDYDGVIADSFEDAILIVRQIAKDIGYDKPISDEDFRELFDQNIFIAIKQKGFSLLQILRIANRLKGETKEMQKKIRFFAGIKELFDEINDLGDIFVVTSNSNEIVRNKMDDYSMLQDIREIYGMEVSKSKVKKIKLVMKKYDKNTDFYYIGDTIGDIIEGRKAGVKTIGVTWGYHDRKRFDRVNPDFIVDKPEELLAIWKR